MNPPRYSDQRLAIHDPLVPSEQFPAIEGGNQTTTVIQDSLEYLPLSRSLRDGDILLLLTPAVAPRHTTSETGHSTSDPFEPLGKALAKKHPWVRQVPYIPRNGITGTHVVHIRLAKSVVFVISGPPCFGQPPQVSLAKTVRSLCENRPLIVLACCNVKWLGPLESSFPTVIQSSGFTPPELEAAARVMVGNVKQPHTAGPNVQNLILAPKSWQVEAWNEHRDVAPAYELWCQCFPDNFRLSRFSFQSLLCRDGYAMHYVVREPGTTQLLGFCATYTTYIGSDSERLVGSLAALFVRPSYRQRGIGLSLHDHASRQLRKTRGVCRLQLGSTFPRLFYGIPMESPSEDWFSRRSWPVKPQSSLPGAGLETCDWLLVFDDWATTRTSPTTLMNSELIFRSCEFSEYHMVMEIVERESREKDNMGWYDQYAKLEGTMNIEDIVLGLEGQTIVAVALTYVKNTGSPVFEDLPWAGMISDNVGGVTCICISDQNPDVAKGRDAIMLRLLDSCVHRFAQQGLKKMFIDAMRGMDEGFQSMGFQKWARYREVWRDV
ncbi:hypothetical protein GE21DRAFT_8125 [Neurospora crassa]|uniref:N-acetyltransferase domain-containing protein n=1 Tax=Neurospora crassa (strain ATCC 24698 / 74-OR23-1A / CBS 708.71 / DSM 1257 / FGSC 987) TaxID=367110 RepID=V5ILX7_NEUCR|nr:uncharacterized protein NCU04132 [Neurospora crassa OR74A]XP_011394619.1 hypothetical protein NCU04132 [Neurospora crassa OR74A]ESA42652.1 hypothetical protein NCU04132 [Neurospora crassa OR74A]ESA42653.1 hypothetical protein, variant [Neurospora crassa OR74A]KHE87389.1 hypothetical protein GE21DRAFT_8125 [Neurospora crassa]|eukprot:XP_011394618.1 uncharacterized protein NCU04132 [Neurospora crassa OR74A]